MPEIPDVEIARRRLEGALKGARITLAESSDRHILRPQSPRALSRALTGRAVRDVSRRGKWLRVLLDDDTRLFSHLGMTGWWIVLGTEGPKERSERGRFDVVKSGGRTASLRYLDSRRFGRLLVAKTDIPEWSTLGPDPLVDGIDAKKLAAAFARSRRAVKEVLMDQSVVAGIGNILATEGLWHARVDPRSRSDALSREDIAAVVRGVLKAIREELAVRLRAKSDDWKDVFFVYGHEGKPCPRDGSPIAKVVIAGRTTAFCKMCQIRRVRR